MIIIVKYADKIFKKQYGNNKKGKEMLKYYVKQNQNPKNEQQKYSIYDGNMKYCNHSIKEIADKHCIILNEKYNPLK